MTTSADRADVLRWRPGASASPVLNLDATDAEGRAAVDLRAPEGLRGAFAGAWTDASGRLHLVRDPLGHRSLYVAEAADGSVAVSTRIGALLRSGAPAQLDPAGLLLYLTTSYVPGARTLVRGVEALPPGVHRVYERGGRVDHPLWDLPAAPAVYEDEDALRLRLRATLEATVARMLPAGPVAASVSGGIDSSLVAALAHHLGAAVTTFSITFGPPHADELAWSGLLARHLGVPHLPVLVRPEDVVARLDRTVGALSEPNGDPLTVPNHLMFEAARAHGLDVMLNGEGGDPCFGGPKNAPMMLAELYGDQRPLAREHDYLRAHQRLWDDLPALARGELADVLATGLAEGCVTPWLDDPRWPSRLDRLMALNVAWKGAGHILPKVEHLGQHSGVRARSPLFDREVVDLAFQVPARLKRAGAVEKHLLKAAVADLVPEAIRERPKSGMMVPVETWFSGPLAGFAAERLLDGALPFDCIDRGWVEALVRGRTGGLRPRRGVKIWLLLTLEAWIRCVMRGG